MTAHASQFLLSHPHRVTAVGRVLYRFAALQVLAGVVAQILTSAMRRAQPHGGDRWIADVWPGLPTWWIPETVLGMVGVTSIAILGLAVAYGGRRFERQWVQTGSW